MQLVPYAPTTKTLNPDELSKLYSMNQYHRPMVPSNMLNFSNIHPGIGLDQQQLQTPNMANHMPMVQANSNSAQFSYSTPYIQQGSTKTF